MTMFVREYYRTPLNLVLLVVIPVVMILSFGSAMSRFADVFEVTLTTRMGQALGALWSASFLTGIMGFFMMVGAREADRRLVRAGYSASQVVVLRLTAVAVMGLFAAGVSYLVLITRFAPSNYGLAFASIYMAAVTYGAVGILIGSLIKGELEGSFALLFFFVMDAFIGSPLFGGASEAFAFLPTHYPSEILSAMVTGESHLAIHWLYAGAYLVIAAGLSALAFHRVARIR